MPYKRKQRDFNALRPVSISPGYLKHPEGSVLIDCGETRILCTAIVQEEVPPWLKTKEKGWVTAEYSMLPGATNTRNKRERGHIAGRTSEIQRLIGRALRAVIDLKQLGPRTILLDCDVLQADGGTRTASITGAYVALYQALLKLQKQGLLQEIPLTDSVAAVSVGIVSGRAYLDLDYTEDSQAEVDMNFVMTGHGRIVEVQGTAEKNPFDKQQFDELFALATTGIEELNRIQKAVIAQI